MDFAQFNTNAWKARVVLERCQVPQKVTMLERADEDVETQSGDSAEVLKTGRSSSHGMKRKRTSSDNEIESDESEAVVISTHASSPSPFNAPAERPRRGRSSLTKSGRKTYYPVEEGGTESTAVDVSKGSKSLQSSGEHKGKGRSSMKHAKDSQDSTGLSRKRRKSSALDVDDESWAAHGNGGSTPPPPDGIEDNGTSMENEDVLLSLMVSNKCFVMHGLNWDYFPFYLLQGRVEGEDQDLLQLYKRTMTPDDSYGQGTPAVIKRILEERIRADFTLIAENGSKIPCHKVFLEASSPIFIRIVNRGDSYKMTAYSEEAIKAFLKFIYLNKVEEMEAEDSKSTKIVLQLLKIGMQYGILGLGDHMASAMLLRSLDWMSVDMALELWVICMHHELDRDSLKALEGLEAQAHVFFQQSSLDGLKTKAVEVLKVKSHVVLQESKLFDQLLRREPDTVKKLFAVVFLDGNKKTIATATAAIEAAQKDEDVNTSETRVEEQNTEEIFQTEVEVGDKEETIQTETEVGDKEATIQNEIEKGDKEETIETEMENGDKEETTDPSGPTDKGEEHIMTETTTLADKDKENNTETTLPDKEKEYGVETVNIDMEADSVDVFRLLNY